MTRRTATWAIVRFRFEHAHCWPAAPDGPQAFLRALHRHEFHVEVRVLQGDLDRDIEYLEAKAWLRSYVEENKGAWPTNWSCEAMASCILAAARNRWGAWRRYSVEVSEDGENGAFITDEDARV